MTLDYSLYFPHWKSTHLTQTSSPYLELPDIVHYSLEDKDCIRNMELKLVNFSSYWWDK